MGWTWFIVYLAIYVVTLAVFWIIRSVMRRTYLFCVKNYSQYGDGLLKIINNKFYRFNIAVNLWFALLQLAWFVAILIVNIIYYNNGWITRGAYAAEIVFSLVFTVIYDGYLIWLIYLDWNRIEKYNDKELMAELTFQVKAQWTDFSILTLDTKQKSRYEVRFENIFKRFDKEPTTKRDLPRVYANYLFRMIDVLYWFDKNGGARSNVIMVDQTVIDPVYFPTILIQNLTFLLLKKLHPQSEMLNNKKRF